MTDVQGDGGAMRLVVSAASGEVLVPLAEALAARDVLRQPRQCRDRQQDLRRRDRQLHRRNDADQRPEADLFEAIARRHAGCQE